MKKTLLLLCCLLGTAAMAQQPKDTHIIPTPQQVTWGKGNFTWNEKAIDAIIIDHLGVPRNEDQAYRLTVTTKSILMEATTPTGLFYAQQSLNQLLRQAMANGNRNIPCMTILDWPDFKTRGWQDDISRGPIVSMDYLKELIPQMAECKLNAFSLYTEHTFRTKSHPDIAPTDAFTPEEIRELDAFCKQYHIELIGNQQCFAHFEEILKNPFYEYLADAPDNLNPSIEATYTFLGDLIGEEAQVYSSPLFNINCDETESLGTGKAKAYVDSIGKETAYYRHINRVNEIVKRHGKRTMMWGDIADQHPEIIDNLDPDIILLAWTYAGSDSYNDFLKPYVNSGHEFMVVPGVSLSERVMPQYGEFERNIPNLCRDGFHAGATGVINTCWDDFGESLTSSAGYALRLGAEKSWNPLGDGDGGGSDEHLHRQLSELAQYNGIGRFSDLTESLIPFYPSLVSPEAEADNRQVLAKLTALEPQLTQPNARYAAHRMMWCAQRNIARCQLYHTYINTTDENIRESQRQLDNLVTTLHQLKCEYLPLWQQESRPYWLEVNLNKYDEVAKALHRLPYTPFIETSSDADGHVVVALRTVYGNQPIHYTLDGKDVTSSDPVYQGPITITQSSLVKAACFDDMGRIVSNERYLLYHKGMGKLKKLNSPAGNYRPEYSGGGDNALLDGRLGSNDYKDGVWQGFYGIDADIELDFKQPETINEIEIGFLTHPHDWILRANQVEIFTSNDGQHYQHANTHHITTNVNSTGHTVFREHIPCNKLHTRYLRIVVKNPGLIPEGLPGYGYDSWIFMDEITFR